MFFQRLITSLILVPLVLSGIFYAPAWLLGTIVLIALLLSGRECWQLIPLEYSFLKILYLVMLVFSCWAVGQAYFYALSFGIIFWVFIIIAIITYPHSMRFWGHAWVIAPVCLLVLSLFAQSLAQIYYLSEGKGLLVYLLFLIWAADVGAYLVGKRWGAHKVIPQVSPGKSWEGVLGGMMVSLLIASIGYWYFTPYSAFIWFTLALVTVVISIFGDLFISILKRRCHLKDTGALIPGHGALLDRLDSLIAAAPVFYLGLTYIPIGI